MHSLRERAEIPGKIKTCGFGGMAGGKTGTEGKERKLGSRLEKTVASLVPVSLLPSHAPIHPSPFLPDTPETRVPFVFVGVFLLLAIARKLNFNFEPRGCRSETNIIIRNNSDTREVGEPAVEGQSRGS